jgi:hypothetical protein
VTTGFWAVYRYPPRTVRRRDGRAVAPIVALVGYFDPNRRPNHPRGFDSRIVTAGWWSSWSIAGALSAEA